MAKTQKKELTEKQKEEKKIEKHQKFIALASKRVSKALHDMSLIGNLAGPGYIYSPAEVTKICNALQERVKEVYEKFQPKAKGEVKKEFTL